MLFNLPDTETLYRALLARDPNFDGQAFVGVRSTGIFCRLTCPARKPRPENCVFFGSAGECIEAGFRPCKRCHPLAAAAVQDPMIGDLLAALEEAPERRWSEDELRRRGYDPSTVRRSFSRQFGMTFLEMARQRRLREGVKVLAAGGKVIAAQYEAGFDSPSAFRAAFARLLGCAPGDLKPGGTLQASWITTPLGDMVAVSSARHLHLLEFVDRKGLARELHDLRRRSGGTGEGGIGDGRNWAIGLGRPEPTEQAARELAAFFAGESATFQTPLAPAGSAFSRAVWQLLREIPAGATRSYHEIAQALGRPGAARAVARANGANRIALMIPCHRVIGADGSLTGYGGGLWRKQRLLDIERHFRTAGL